MKLNRILGGLFLASMSLNISADVITNSSVIELLKKGYNSETIINHVEGQDEVRLSSGIDALDVLMEAGADQNLISYIQRKTKKEKDGKTGLYWWNVDEGQHPQKVNLVAIEQKTSKLNGGFLGSAVSIAGTVAGVTTGSVGTMTGSWIAGDVLASSGFKSDRLYIPGGHSRLKVSTQSPVFRFTVPSDESLSPTDWTNLWLHSVESPNEFQLIKLESKGKGNKANRAFPANLKWGTMGFSTQNIGTMKNIVAFEVRQVNNKVFEIYFPSELEPGEYAFFYRNASHPLIKDRLSAFDFTIE